MAKKYVSLMNTTKNETEKKYVPLVSQAKTGRYIPYVQGTCGKLFAAPEMATGKQYVSLTYATASSWYYMKMALDKQTEMEKRNETKKNLDIIFPI